MGATVPSDDVTLVTSLLDFVSLNLDRELACSG